MKQTDHLTVSNKSIAFVLPALLTIFMASCNNGPSNEPPNAKSTVPIRGEIYVDGEPGTGIRVELHPLEGVDGSNPSFTGGQTGDNSTFEVGTYSGNDGAPVGEYKLTFFRTDITKMRFRAGSAEDLLGEKYIDPEKSEINITVRPLEGEEEFLDVGRIDLTTDAKK